MSDEDYRQRILPIVVDGEDILSASSSDVYGKYWDRQYVNAKYLEEEDDQNHIPHAITDEATDEKDEGADEDTGKLAQ